MNQFQTSATMIIIVSLIIFGLYAFLFYFDYFNYFIFKSEYKARTAETECFYQCVEKGFFAYYPCVKENNCNYDIKP